MPKSIDATRRAAFLRALAKTGNQTLAAERAKVSRSWVRLHRGQHPEFDAQVRAALAAHRPATHARGPAFARGGYFEGRELVRRGVNARRIQVARARPREWSPAAERRFLSVLAQTCSLTAACETVGLSATRGCHGTPDGLDRAGHGLAGRCVHRRPGTGW